MSQPLNQTPAPATAGDKLELDELKEKIKYDIQKLNELAQKYNIDASAPDFILTYLDDIVDKIYDNDNKMPESINEVLTLAAEAIDVTIDEVVKYSKALAWAYDNDDVKGMVNSFTKLYADLSAIYALLRFIKRYLNVSYIINELEEILVKAGNITYIIAEYLSNNVKLSSEAIDELSKNLKYFTELKNNNILREEFNEIENEIETTIELKRGTQLTLSEILYVALSYMRAGIAIASNTGEMLANAEYFTPDLEIIIANVIEAYADLMTTRMIYIYILSEYVRAKEFKNELEKAINNISYALDIILSNYFS